MASEDAGGWPAQTFANGSDGFYLLSRRSRGEDAAAAAEDLLDYRCKAAKVRQIEPGAPLVPIRAAAHPRLWSGFA